MIFFDVTKAGSAGHRSGLMRVSARLADGLKDVAKEVRWGDWDRKGVRADDWFLTGELFSEEERPGLTAFLEQPPCRLAAIFHDAIPLKHPHITWPQSVARHPGYMKLLSRFDRVWAVSHASREELVGFWRWAGIERVPPVAVLTLGADFNSAPRQPAAAMTKTQRAQLLTLGILEPRKNQSLVLDASAELWRSGVFFDLHVVGRVNPHFGKPIVAQLTRLRRE